MQRRNFLRFTSLAAAGMALGQNLLAMPRGAQFPMGYQLFSVRDAMAADALGTLRALIEMGYEHFEAYGYNAVEDSLYGLAPKQLQIQLDSLGTRITSAHFGFADYLYADNSSLHRYVDACLGAAEALDLRYLVWPIIKAEHRTLDGFKHLSERLSIIGEQVAAAGRRFAFHNNGGEFTDLGGGVRGYDIVLAEADPSYVALELDMYWLAHESQLTPGELFARQPGRFALWHVKDMAAGSKDYTELGVGTIDYRGQMPDAQASGLQLLYLEQGGNYATSSMASAATNATYWQQKLAPRL